MFSFSLCVIRDFVHWMRHRGSSVRSPGVVDQDTHDQLMGDFQHLKQAHDKLLAARGCDYCIAPHKTSGPVSRETLQKRFRATGKWRPSTSRNAVPKTFDKERMDNLIRFMWDKDKKKTGLVWIQQPDHPSNGSKVPLKEAMSSALLLYRLHCLFPGSISPIKQNDLIPGTAWTVSLKHMKTGLTVLFTEKEGGCHIVPDTFHISNIKSDVLYLRNELTELIDLLFAEDFPHPMVGLVAGSTIISELVS